MVGNWLMRKADIAGLTPNQIRAKYNLPEVPTHIVDAKLPRGTKVKVSLSAKIKAFGSDVKDGAIQYEIVKPKKEIPKKWFDLKNMRKL